MRSSVGTVIYIAHDGFEQPGLSRRIGAGGRRGCGGGMMNTDPMRDTKDALIRAVLPEVPFSGWTMAALAQAAKSAGLDASMAERAFPGGVADAVLHFVDLADRLLAEDAGKDGLEGLRLTGRIRWLIRHRLEAWAEHREAV